MTLYYNFFYIFNFRFKKPKKKVKKLRKKLKAEDLEPLPADVDSSNHRKRDPNRHLSNVLDTDDVPEFKEDIKIEEEDNELEHILSKVSFGQSVKEEFQFNDLQFNF